MKLVYIAGPYRAPTTWGVDQNIHRAREIGAIVAGLGAYPIIPHSNTAHMDGAADDVLWLAGTLELMRRCDAVVVAPRWERSTGTRAEIDEAMRLEIPVFMCGTEGWESSLVRTLNVAGVE
jgi:nucleoside 2-deoxyribosyltransferase